MKVGTTMKPTSTDPKPLWLPHGTIIQEEDTKDYYIFDANDKMWIKLFSEWIKPSECPMFDICQNKTAACRCMLPDESCPWYQWFKQRINDVEDGK